MFKRTCAQGSHERASLISSSWISHDVKNPDGNGRGQEET